MEKWTGIGLLFSVAIFSCLTMERGAKKNWIHFIPVFITIGRTQIACQKKPNRKMEPGYDGMKTEMERKHSSTKWCAQMELFSIICFAYTPTSNKCNTINVKLLLPSFISSSCRNCHNDRTLLDSWMYGKNTWTITLRKGKKKYHCPCAELFGFFPRDRPKNV